MRSHSRTPSHCIALANATPGIEYITQENLPDVASEAVHIHYIAHDSTCGRAFAGAGTAPELAESLLEIVAEPARLQAFSAAARARATSFSIDAMVDRTLAVYQDCLQSGGGGAADSSARRS